MDHKPARVCGVHSIPVGIGTGNEKAPAGLLAPASRGPLADLLPLVLGDDAFHLKQKPPLWGGILGNGQELDLDPCPLELVRKQELVRQSPGKPIRVVDEDHLERSRPDRLPQTRERRPLKIRAGVPIVEELGSVGHGIALALGVGPDFDQLGGKPILLCLLLGTHPAVERGPHARSSRRFMLPASRRRSSAACHLRSPGSGRSTMTTAEPTFFARDADGSSPCCAFPRRARLSRT